MKKLNNKGFAISTILYSLLIMVFLIVALLMGIMSSNRQNTVSLVKTIEDELNRYSLTSTEFLPVSGASSEAQEYIVPFGQAGWYKVELWGASGADSASNSSVKGGAGAYTSGIIYLEENTLVFFYVGGQGSSRTGGFNGGGNGVGNGRGGGGATDMRTMAGEWNDQASLSTRIMVAAGGSGASGSKAGQSGGTLESYSSTEAVNGKGATQIAGGAAGTSATAGELGKGGNGHSHGSGGGGGLYGGGGGGGSAGVGAGGSSYISGYAGVATNGDYSKTKNGDKYFIDGMMAENVNRGAGKAKIELISTNSKDNPPTKKTMKLNAVRWIKDCVSGIGSATSPQWLEIQAIHQGENKAYNNANALTNGEITTVAATESGYSTSAANAKCKTIELPGNFDLDEIAVWHNTSTTVAPEERVLLNHTISVSDDNTTWRTIRKVASTGEYQTSPEGTIGTHISAWDTDVESEIPNGTYYLFSALAPYTSLVTAQNSLIVVDADGDGNTTNDPDDAFQRFVTLNKIDGTNLQKWTITKVGSYYKLVEKESNQAMQIMDNLGQAHENSNINTSSAYNDFYEWADWEIISLGDGTYRIKPRIQPSTDPSKQSYLATNTNSFGLLSASMVLRTLNTTDESFTQRFYIMSAE